MGLQDLLDSFGPAIEDPEEESFLLFSQSIPSQNLGFVDSKATVVEVSIGERDLLIHQSPTILSSTRGGGTTGAVIWKITPLFASWISLDSNPLFTNHVLTSHSTIIELGCGISGIIALSTAPLIANYTLTDQEYALKLLSQNLSENNHPAPQSQANKSRKSTPKSRKPFPPPNTILTTNITTTALDWETDQVSSSLAGIAHDSFDAVIACDCIYNDALITPFVQTCIDVCRLRTADAAANPDSQPTLCIIAQQLRSPEVFEAWLKAFHKAFRTWRFPDLLLTEELRSNSGFVVHVGVLR